MLERFFRCAQNEQAGSIYQSSIDAFRLLMKLSELSMDSQNTLSLLVQDTVTCIREEFAFLTGVDDLASRMGVSKSYLIRTFSAEMGVTPGHFLQDTRLEYAALLLQGREFSIAVIESRALPVIEIAPLEGFYDYKNKYKAGSTIETCPADLPPAIASQMQEYAVAVTKVLELDTYARVDFMLDAQNRIFCLEANTLPGMTPTSLIPQEAQAIGMGFDDLCEKIIHISLDKTQHKE